MKKSFLRYFIFLMLLVLSVLTVSACEFNDETEEEAKFYINDNTYNETLKNNSTKDDAIDNVDEGITNLREYLNQTSIATTGYYMGVEFNINTLQPTTLKGGNFRLKIQAHLYTYPYEDEDGNPIYKYYDKHTGTYFDEQNEEGTRVLTKAEDIHNETIKKSDILIEWYDGVNNQMLIGLYYDGINNNSDDPGNILYVNIQGGKRYFLDFGDTVLYRQMIRLLTSLSVESLLTAGNVQQDAGVSTIRQLFDIAVNDNYKIVLNEPITSTLFYNIAADALADTLTSFYQNLFSPFENKIDPLTKKYLGFKFSIMADAITNTVNSDMQFFTQLNNEGTSEIMTGAYLTFNGNATSDELPYDYVSDINFEYGAYPPEDMKLDKDYYTLFENGKYEFIGNLYIPMLNSNYDALIRTNMNRYDNSTNNVFTEFRDIANGELMIGTYYKNELTYLDISGLEYLYGAIALDELGFPKVYDDSMDLAQVLTSFAKMTDDMIISIVDGILSPDKNDKENHLLEYIMDKTKSTEKDPKDIFSKNTVTLTVDMELIKHALEETGNGTYTTRQVINILDSFSPYSMDQIATIMGVASAEVMMDKTYFTICLNVDTNEITIKMFTDVGIEAGENSTLIFQLDVTPTHFGEYVDIAEVNFDGFNELGQIYTYSATMDGNFMFSTAEVVDLSYLLGATIGDSSGKNTVYQLNEESGVSFKLQYDQYVLDQTVDGVLHKGGRSSFNLQVWITGHETTILLRLASDDVAFNNDVYERLPESEDELGYVWVDIQCIYEKDGTTRRIPKLKIREDVFMSSMQAYMNNSSISDDASKLGESDLNLSITTILFALMEDSYVVAQPEKIEITTSNETVQNLFRVKSLIGNIKTDAGFRTRVTGLDGVKQDYAMYKVGSFTNMEVYSPYAEEAILHDTIPVYYYNDYMSTYDPLKYEFRVCEDNSLQVYYEGKYKEGDFYYYEQRYIVTTQKVDGVDTEVKVPQRTKVESGIVSIMRETIENSADSFFTSQAAENQDITKVRFLYYDASNPAHAYYTDLSKLIYYVDGDYIYNNYDATQTKINAENYVIREETTNGYKIYIKWQGITDRVYYESGKEYYFYNDNLAVTDIETGGNVYLAASTNRNYLFDYDEKSIEITNEAKSQYAPRFEGSFMGEVRRYYLTITSPNAIDRSVIYELNNFVYYCEEDKNNIVEIYNDDGVKLSEKAVPIPLYIMEPAEDLTDKILTLVDTPKGKEEYTHNALYIIDWDKVTLKGYMLVTTVTVAPGTMGEVTYPIRIIVSNREIIPNDDGDAIVDLYDTNSEIKAEGVPVVDSIEIDPYDYILAKYEYFLDTTNFNPTQYTSAEFDAKVKSAEIAFNIEYFSTYVFNIVFNADNSILRADGVYEKYIYKSYTNKLTDNTMDLYDWYLDEYDGSTQNIESAISPEGGIIFLHTHFKGQLIALRVVVGKRTFDHMKFSASDTYQTTTIGGLKINGHYMANYYDEASYTVPTASTAGSELKPIFVFTDQFGNKYEKQFNFTYVYDLDSNGNYLTKNYEISWANTTITNIGSMGSYYYEHDLLETMPSDWVDGYSNYYTRTGSGTTADPYYYTQLISTTAFAPDTFYEIGELVNRPFYIDNAARDANGQVTLEGEPTETSNRSDIDTSTLNLRYSLCLYKYDDNKNKIAIPMISGTDSDEWFKYLVLCVQVECPQLEVDDIGTTENDDVNNVEFTPSAIGIGSTTIGYYQIDPLDTSTNILPTTVKIYFMGADGNRVSHTFSNIEWKNFNLANEVIVYNAATNTYTFNLSTDTPMTTQVVAKVGSAISGYQDIVLCIKVLSKDPQNVEFYIGDTTQTTNKINAIEQISVVIGDLSYYNNVSYTVSSNDSYVSYAYYVDTFSNFILPNYLIATFGTSINQRKVTYATNWTLINSEESPVYQPNSVVNLVTTIGDGEVVIKIYLAVIVENYSINRIDINSELQNFFVKVGDNTTYHYETLSSLYQRAILSENKLGFYYIDGSTLAESYIVVSTGSVEDGAVVAGKIGLYLMNGDIYELQSQIYPYEFINEMYSNIDIIFNEADVVDLWNFEYALNDIYVYVNDGTTTVSQKLTDIINLKYVYDNSTQKNTITVDFLYNNGTSDYYLVVTNGIVDLYPNSYMVSNTKISVSLQALTNALVLLEMSSDDLLTRTITEAYTMRNEIKYPVDFNNATVQASFGYSRGIYTFYDVDGVAATFQFINIDGYGEMSYEEFLYRLIYCRTHRTTSIIPTKISGKETTITDIAGIFSVNDVIVSRTEAFTESTNYKISIGTAKGSFDLTLKLIFGGGLRSSVSTDKITVYAYNANGYAQYGDYGYVFSSEIITNVITTKQDITMDNLTFTYGYTSEKLIYWYVEMSGYSEVVEDTTITSIPQSVVYANSDKTITLSTLTSQGFRIYRTFEFKGVTDDISTYDSVNSILEIDNGVIYIEDIYNYYPLTAYFASNSNLPGTIEITTSRQVLRVSDIAWEINNTWNDGGSGNLYNMTYMGTYNEVTHSSSNTLIASAKILGWTSIVNGVTIQNDTIDIQLYINIESAEAVSLPWSEKNPKLETAALSENGETIFAVDVDAFNDSSSSAINGSNLVPPTSIIVQYTNGNIHTFNDVVYTFRNVEVTNIPYTKEGINIVSFASLLNIPQAYFNAQYIDLQVDLGLMQEITIRFRFYDKTVENISAIVSLDDSIIRKHISDAMSAISSKKEDELIDLFNLTRIETNIETLIGQAKLIRDRMVIPTVAIINENINIASDLRLALRAAFAGITTYEGVTYPTETPYSSQACWNYAYDIMSEFINNDSNLSTYITNIQKYRGNNTKIAQYITDFYSNMVVKSYENIIYEYVEEELLLILDQQTNAMDAVELNYAIYYKNVVEANIDVEAIIKGIYRAKELFNCGKFSQVELDTAVQNIFLSVVNDAITDAQKATNNTLAMSSIIDNIFKAQFGLISTYEGYIPLSGNNVNYFIANKLNNTKVEMREIINNMITKSMDFSLDMGTTFALSAKMIEALGLATKQAYASTASLSTSIAAIRSNITAGISSTTAIDTLFKRAISNYVDKIYMESKIGTEIKRVQEEGVLSDSYYIIDPYSDYLYVPTKLIADFNESTGGFSYTFNATWSNDTVSNSVKYNGNAKSDEYSYIEMWIEIYGRYDEITVPKSYLDDLFTGVTPTENWTQIKANNQSIYDILMNIENTLTKTFASYGLYSESATIDEKSLILYTYYRAGQSLYDNAVNNASVVNSSWGMDSEEIIRCYDEYKYNTLTATLYLSTTSESQELKMVVKVLNRTIDSGDIVIKDDEGAIYTKYTVENPFTTMVKDLPSNVAINGINYPIVWKNVTISPNGNLSATNKVIYGNIKNSNGQQVSMTLVVNKWSYTSMRQVTGKSGEDDIYTLMNSSGYLNFYFNAYQEYSAEEYYQVVFNISSLDNNDEEVVETRNVTFYPEDSTMLINTTDDAQMALVKDRKNYILYWDSTIKSSVINTASSTVSLEGSVFLGNETVGSFNLTKLADTTVSNVVTAGKYFYENMAINSIQLIKLESGEDYYSDVSTYLMARSGEVTLILNESSYFPETGDVIINDANSGGNIDYTGSDIKVRLIWNVNYDTAITKLIGFVSYTYPDVATNEVTEKAKNILMNIGRTETEEEELLKLAIKYIKYDTDCTHLGTECAVCEKAAYQLLCLNEKYNYEGNVSYLNGGINSKSVTVIVQVGDSTSLYTETVNVKVVFSDYTSMGNYYLTNPSVSETEPTNYTLFNYVQETSLPTTVYVAVRSDYWDDTDSTNSYEAEGKIVPYNTTDNFIFKLLDINNKLNTSGLHLTTMNLLKVTNIIYGSVVNGYVTSTAFTINGVQYNSDMISLRVS